MRKLGKKRQTSNETVQHMHLVFVWYVRVSLALLLLQMQCLTAERTARIMEQS